MSAHKVNRDLHAAGYAGIPTFCYDSVGNITFASGADIPTGAGYAYGCLFVQNDATTPGAGVYINVGTTTTANFVPQASVAAAIVITVPTSGLTGDSFVAILPVGCTLVSIKNINSAVVSGGTATRMMVRQITANTVAPGAAAGATCIEIVTAGISIAAGVNTLTTASLAVTSFAAGDRIAIRPVQADLVTSGTTTGLIGQITMQFYPT